jgi:dimethylhistidine N-methyltransferase
VYEIRNRLQSDPEGEIVALEAGLLTKQASIAPKYFYDPLGCALFCAICELDEYYPTRTEAAIFVAHREEIAEAAGRGRQLVDLGAGNCAKAACWMPYLAPRRYVAVDVSLPTLEAALSKLSPDYPDVDMLGVATDFSREVDLAADLAPLPTTFFYPGSSIGNFTPDGAVAFLGQLRALGGPDGNLLIGVDTKKDKVRLDAAYDDALGVTAAFNRNVLRHVNRLLGSNFDLAGFGHRGFYNADEGRIEMHLEALRDQAVTIGKFTRTFRAGERIHTENSYKYAPAEFEALLRRAGYAAARCWQDAAGDFSVFVAS